MDDILKTFETNINALHRRVDEKKESIIVCNMMGDKQGHYAAIFALLVLVNKSLQCGNYKRAFRYYLVASKIINQFEKNEKEMLKKITDYIIKD